MHTPKTKKNRCIYTGTAWRTVGLGLTLALKAGGSEFSVAKGGCSSVVARALVAYKPCSGPSWFQITVAAC